MSTLPSFGMTTTLSVPYAEAIERVREALAVQGFGVLTTIDVKATMQNKLDIETRPYVILGACNPPLAHRALDADPAVGLLLPCNVIVFEGDTPTESVVSVIDPMTMVTLSDNPVLAEVATQARARLEQVVASLS